MKHSYSLRVFHQVICYGNIKNAYKKYDQHSTKNEMVQLHQFILK